MNASGWARVKSLFLKARESSSPSHELPSAGGSTANEVRRLLAFAEAGSATGIQLERSEAEDETGKYESLFAPGTMVASRFRIVRMLGRGGMGEVYEALDVVKNLPIALKVIRPEPSNDPATAEQLLRKEVLVAQLVSHRNVCRIHDPYVHHPPHAPPIMVLSMELLRGQTLAELLTAKGRLSLSQVLPLARQLAAGIDAAHAVGVVHRDLKPSNVMLVEDGSQLRVVITDFGLARSQTPGQSTANFSRAVAGTLRYMAPEQLEGRTSSRSDLYSFAIILFEMLTGELPFSGDSDLAAAINRLSLPPRDPANLVRGIPLVWRAALLKGLHRNPKRRFTSAASLLASIESPGQPVLTSARLMLHRAFARHTWRRWTALGVFAAAAACLMLLLRPPPSRFPPFSHILIADLEHASTSDAATLGANLSLVSTLSQSPHLSASRPSDFAGTMLRMGAPVGEKLDLQRLRQIALRTEQGAILTGSISGGHGYNLHLHLEAVGPDPRRPVAAADNDFPAGNDKELFDAIAAAAQWVRSRSGELSRDLNEQRARPEDLTTNSWQALSLLQQARSRRDAGDPQAALVFAREALDIDGQFAAAESLEGDLLTQMRQYREGFAAHKRALDLVKKRNITGRERYQIEAVYNTDASDDDASLETYKAWVAHFPNDFLPHFYLSYLDFHRANYATALAEMQLARKLKPFDYTIYPHLATYYLANGDKTGAADCARALRQLGESDWALEVEAQMLLAGHRFEEAAAKIRPLLSRSDTVFSTVAPLYAANALADAGHFDAAEKVLAEAAEGDRRRGSVTLSADRQLVIAYLRWLRGDPTGAVAALKPSFTELDNPDALSLAGAVFARGADVASAHEVTALLQKWPAVPVVTLAKARLRAEIALALHAPDASHLVNAVKATSPSPLVLEFQLHAAIAQHLDGQIKYWAHQIESRHDVLLSWEVWASPPGTYWMALRSASQ